MAETIVRIGEDVRLCVDTTGDPADPAVLLLAGTAQSMDWWETEFCDQLAARGRFVVRYDQRDTGRSTRYPPGAPGYTWNDLQADALAILDALGVGRAHLVGLSAGGGMAQCLALEHRDRIASLTLMATSAIDPHITGLPGPTEEIRATFSAPVPEIDPTDRDAVIQHLVDIQLPYGSFDEAHLREIAARVADRSADVTVAEHNHGAAGGDDPADARMARLAGLPTLVVHGTIDPLFPVEHGRALAAAIPGARLLELDGVGHQQPPRHTWDTVLGALIEHTTGNGVSAGSSASAPARR